MELDVNFTKHELEEILEVLSWRIDDKTNFYYYEPLLNKIRLLIEYRRIYHNE